LSDGADKRDGNRNTEPTEYASIWKLAAECVLPATEVSGANAYCSERKTRRMVR